MPFKSAKKRNAVIETKSLHLPPLMLALEPRYVFDAAMASEILDAAHDVTVADLHIADHAAAGAEVVAAANAFDAEHHASGLADTDHQVGALIEAAVTAHNMAPAGTEVAFIDNRLADLGGIISAIPDGTRIVLIDSGSDAVAQMVDALKNEHDLTGIHIISHGTPGSLQLGSSTLDLNSITTTYRDALSSLQSHLTADADILVYGCDFGAGDQGAAAASALADITGADIASSDDLTGAAERGGNWILEVKVCSTSRSPRQPK